MSSINCTRKYVVYVRFSLHRSNSLTLPYRLFTKLHNFIKYSESLMDLEMAFHIRFFHSAKHSVSLKTRTEAEMRKHMYQGAENFNTFNGRIDFLQGLRSSEIYVSASLTIFFFVLRQKSLLTKTYVLTKMIGTLSLTKCLLRSSQLFRLFTLVFATSRYVKS